MIPEVAQMPYEERCKQLGIQTLVNTRTRGDMIQTFKILMGYDNEVRPPVPLED